MKKSVYEEIDHSAFLKISYQIDILIVTATDLETTVLHTFLRPLDGYTAISMCYKGALTYYLGYFGRYKIIHVQSGMGSILRDGSIMTITEAINQVNPKAVFMIGIAFGIDRIKQKIGDVLVSEAIIRYNFVKVEKGKKIFRANSPEPNKILANRFKNIKGWDFSLPYRKKADIIVAPILSGEELINDIIHRDELLTEFPLAKGGEMEGAGLYAACDGKASWILVKGICDFADGNKDIKKDANQKVAMEAATAACLHLFNSETAFNDINIYVSLKKEEINYNISTNVLYEVYDKSKEQYYLQRQEDINFSTIIDEYGAWLFGESGCGKSSVILRNLLNKNKEVLQINLAGCVRSKIDDIFKVILTELYFVLNKDITNLKSEDFNSTLRLIVETLLNNYSEREIYLVIEEIPIGEANDYEEFAEKLFQLIIYKSSFPSLNKVKFILSSLNSPIPYIKPFQRKVKQQVKFIDLQLWNNEQLSKLIDLIEEAINYNLSFENKDILISNSVGSPRFVKSFFRNLLILRNFTVEGVDYALSETIKDK